MTYRLILAPEAEIDLEAHIKSGNKALLKKIFTLFEELKQHPCIGTGKPEQLKYDLAGKWSRRINGEHRMVYIVRESDKAVDVLALRYHYPK
ncbi:MAG: Txe/YoeB family addiction module toxin [Tannerella sp.]|jgi:toxin YoeB|nr:Txe/YoeB family addiction module toxin [Tannerella sp.]